MTTPAMDLLTEIKALAADAARWRHIMAVAVLGIRQNGNGWSLHFDGVAPDSMVDVPTAIDAMKEKP